MKKIILTGLFVVSGVIVCYAQSLAWRDAVNAALQNNLNLQIESNNVQLATTANNKGTAGGLPLVTASVSNQESMIGVNQNLNSGTVINRSGILSNNLNGNIIASWLLYNGNRVVTTKKRLEAIETQSKSLLNASIQNVMAAVTVSYFDVVRQQALLHAVEEALTLTKKQVNILETRKKIGLASESDWLQTQIDLRSREQEMLAQQTVIEQSRAALFSLMRWPADTTITLSDSILMNKDILLSEVLAKIEQHPEIQSLDQQITINKFLEKEISALRKPSIIGTIGVNYNRSKAGAGQFLLNQTYGPYIGLGISIPIFNGGNVTTQEELAKIRTRNAMLQKQDQLEESKNQVWKIYQVYSSGLGQVAKQQTICTMTAQLSELTLQKFQLNAATIIEVREAQKSYQEAAYRLQHLLYTTKVAETELKRLSNQLGL